MMGKTLRIVGAMVLLAGVLVLPAIAADEPAASVATMSAGAASLDFTPAVNSYDKLILTVSGPGGLVTRQEFKAGEMPSLSLFNKRGQKLADGNYTYELRVVPVLDKDARDRLAAARQAGDERAAIAELRRAGRLTEGQVQSGAFAIAGGSFVTPGQEERRPRKAPVDNKAGGLPHVAAADQVIPDDLIVQGSACVGLDCVNNESFGFDTIRLKENNTRIKFDDTSTGAGFPANDWQLTANDSASGGSSKFSIEDITGSKVPFTITAGASTNSIFVDSTGRVGLRTSTPVLDLHINTSNTPAIRLEQNNSGGFTAQTWDIAGNEANFFVRDVTGGSRLPLRIRPGAPTSSVDISADGDVGIGTASPEVKLHVFCSNTQDCSVSAGPNPVGTPSTESALNIAYAGASTGAASAIFNIKSMTGAVAPNPSLRFWTADVERMIIDDQGFIGLGIANPTSPIHHSSGAILTAGGTWQNGSSRDIKQDIVDLATDEAMTTLRGLEPVKYAYKVDPKEHHVGFIAEDVPDLVASQDRKSLSPMDIVAVLTKVVQEQQKKIDELSAKVSELEQQKQQ